MANFTLKLQLLVDPKVGQWLEEKRQLENRPISFLLRQLVMEAYNKEKGR